MDDGHQTTKPRRRGSAGGGSLDAAYPTGGSRFDVAFSGSHLGTTRFTAASELDAEARAAFDSLAEDERERERWLPPEAPGLASTLART